MFEPLRYDSGMLETQETASSTTITKGDALEFASGYVQRADNATTEVRYVAMEDKTTGAGDNEDILVLYVDGVEFEVATDDNMAQSYIGTYVDLTDHDSIDPDSGTDDVFYVTKMIGATTDKTCRGYFVVKAS